MILSRTILVNGEGNKINHRHHTSKSTEGKTGLSNGDIYKKAKIIELQREGCTEVVDLTAIDEEIGVLEAVKVHYSSANIKD